MNLHILEHQRLGLIGFKAGPQKVGICWKILIFNVGRYLQEFDKIVVVMQILTQNEKVHPFLVGGRFLGCWLSDDPLRFF